MVRRLIWIALCLLPLGVWAQTQARFGYLNYSEVLKAHPQYAEATAQLAGLEGKYDAEIQRSEDEFNRNAPSIVAYGEFQSGTDVSGTERNGYKLVEFPLEYYRTNVTPKYLIIVCSSSKYGNLFTGGEGSTLYLDEMELVYE